MDLKAKGLGNKFMTSDSLTDKEIEKLYSKCLGIGSPQAIINTLWLNCGLCGVKEQRELHWADVKLKQMPDEKEYVKYSVERQTKTRTGSDPRDYTRRRLSHKCTQLLIYLLREIQFVFTNFMQASAWKA